MSKKILIIIIFAFLLRLIDITFPISGWHSWRQADTAAMARNFYSSGHSIVYPQIDWRGNTEGFVESEFPLYQYLISLFYRIFGVEEIIGRLLSVFASLCIIFGLYLIVKKILGEKTALTASLIYSVLPLNIYFNRAFMPETVMMTFSVWGIYFFIRWIDDDKITYFIISFIFISLAALLKLPSLYLGLPLAYLSFKKYGVKTFYNYKILFFTVIVFLIVALWYYHSHQLYLLTGLTFGIWTPGTNKWLMFDMLLKPSFYNDLIFKSIAERHLTYAGFIIFIWGLFIKRTKEKEFMFDFWLIAIIIFFLIVPEGNLSQEYYQLPFNIVASVFISKVIVKYYNIYVNRKSKLLSSTNRTALVIILICLTLLPVLSAHRLYNFYKQENKNSAIFELSEKIQSVSDKSDLIITVSEGNPVFLYNANRKGWVCNMQDVNKNYLNEKKSKGAKYLLADKTFLKDKINPGSFAEVIKIFKTVSDNDKFIILEL